MASPDTTPTPATPPRGRPRRRRFVAAATSTLGVAILVALALGTAWLSSENALGRLVGLLVAESGGRIEVEGASGSLLGSFKLRRVSYRDADTRIVAEDIAIAFRPRSLFRGRLLVSELRSGRVTFESATGDNTPVTLPDSIALPIDVRVERLRIDRLDWRVGGNSGVLDGLSLAYSSDPATHRFTELELAARGFAFSGTASIATTRPFATAGSLSLALSKPNPEGRIDATFSGQLEALQVHARSSVGGWPAELRARLAPLARAPFIEGRLEASGIDLARLDASWPVTRIALTVDARDAPGGYSGRVTLANAIAGPVDASRLPLQQAQSAFTFADNVVAFTGLSVRGAGGMVEGEGSVAMEGIQSRWKLVVRSLDLALLHSALLPTRLDGSIQASANAHTQRVIADVAQGTLQFSGDAVFDGETLQVERLRVQGHGGSLEGNGRVALAAARPFTTRLVARRFDPSRFGSFPSGALDGTLSAAGTLSPALVADLDVAVVPGSRLAGLAASGKLRGRFTQATVRALDADLVLGANRLQAGGAYGASGDKLAIRIAAKRLAELAPLLPGHLPRNLAGALEATATIEDHSGDFTLTLDARATGIDAGAWRFAAIQARGQLAHREPLEPLRVDALHDVALEVEATGAITPLGRATRARASLTGGADQHTLAFSIHDDELGVEGRASGTLLPSAPLSRWRGRIESLASRGIPGIGAATLSAPADLELGSGYVVLGAARVAAAEARLDVDGASWRDGALETRGRVRGLPLAPFVKHAGLDGRVPTDVTVGGAWVLGSHPDWHGSLDIAREQGDVYVDDPAIEGARRIALGLQTLVLKAGLEGTRLSGTAELRAKLGGNALADFQLDAPAGSSHPFSKAAQLRGSIRAHLPSLATLQPWVGTAARVDGQAIGDIALAGTLADPTVTGQLVGYGLRLDMHQHGVSYRDGELRIASGPEGLKLEQLSFKAGEGRFVASGNIGLRRDGASEATRSHIDWKVENFRALNRPDRRLVVDGEGTLGFQAGRLLLRGKLSADEGSIDYRSEADTALADDIVIVGRPRPGQTRSNIAGASDVPLDLDLALELGRDLRFTADGLEARLAGRVQVTSKGGGPVTAKGVIRTVRGTYWAFGQRLTIERGRVIFDGPLANPSLDVVALRKNLTVEAGVEIMGTARAPLIRLTSNPQVPDSEKLAWLLTGGPSGSGNARESAALQAASAALLGTGGRPVTHQIAQSIGLDDLSVAQRETTTASPASGQVVSLGKRITDKLYVAYEQGLTIATNALRVEYALTRTLTLAAFAGTNSGIALNFRRSWP